MTAKVELLTPSGGKVILDPSDTAVDRTLTLPALAGTVLNTASDIEAQVKTATSATGDAPIFSCRAWVNFDGTGTVAIRASGNVSSITDNGTGDYTVNFTTAMPDANFVTNASVRREAAFSNPPTIAIEQYGGTSRPNTTTTTTVMCGDQSSFRDSSLVLVSIFR